MSYARMSRVCVFRETLRHKKRKKKTKANFKFWSFGDEKVI